MSKKLIPVLASRLATKEELRAMAKSKFDQLVQALADKSTKQYGVKCDAETARPFVVVLLTALRKIDINLVLRMSRMEGIPASTIDMAVTRYIDAVLMPSKAAPAKRKRAS